MPLLLRGARQVGKTYIVEKFGQKAFSTCLTLNFEQRPEWKECFTSLDPVKIKNALELVSGQTLNPQTALLFLDEIQECPEAIMALRYFKEQMPELAVIGAGSLLEFALNDPNFRMPVGRVQFLYLRPLSFGEFLDAMGHAKLRNYLQLVQIEETIEAVVHKKLLTLIREYFALGGMPAVINEYLQSKSLRACQEIQTNILTAFRLDFGKYAARTPHEHLQNIFAKAPGLIGQWLKYTTIDAETAPRTLKNAIKKLSNAGLISLVYATSAAGLPFATHMNEKKCKFLFLDIGLAQRACHLSLELLFNEDLSLINDGALAEQFVGQELLAHLAKEEPNELFTWTREEKNSSAEVDFLVAVDAQIIPIEVKSGAIGTLRSLKLLLSERKMALGIRISEAPLHLHNSILSIPFYLIEQLPRFVKAMG